jgi:hypothetical protein
LKFLLIEVRVRQHADSSTSSLLVNRPVLSGPFPADDAVRAAQPLAAELEHVRTWLAGDLRTGDSLELSRSDDYRVTLVALPDDADPQPVRAFLKKVTEVKIVLGSNAVGERPPERKGRKR